MTTFRVVGAGRAGSAVHAALGQAGWTARTVVRHGDPLHQAAHGVDYLILAVRDGDIPGVADAVDADPATVVVHLAGSSGPEILGHHPLRAAVHPLASLTPERGQVVLRSGIWFGVAADPGVESAAQALVSALGGRLFIVPPEQRALYHATACVASNHLVALFGQVERLADRLGLPMEAFMGLASGTLDNIAAVGATAALTGPVARGDWATVQRHREALDPEDRDLYEALAGAAARLAGRVLPPPASP